MKKILLKYWPVLFIVSIWLIFVYPFLIKGLVPFSTTYLVDFFHPWNVYSDYAGPVKNNAISDVINQIYPWKTLVMEGWINGVVPLWNPYSFSGTPLLANYQAAALSPTNLLYFIFPFITAWSIQVLLQPLLAGIFMFMFSRAIKLSPAASLISSIAFMFCGFITSWMAWGTLPYAILFLPLALFAVEKYFETAKPAYIVLLAITVPLSFFSGHFQTSLYFLLFIIAYLLFKYITTRNLPKTLISSSAVFSGLLLSAPQLLPSIEFYLQSVRSEFFQKSEVIPWHYLPTFIAPDFFGNPVTRNDWLGHYAEWNFYIGVIPLVLVGFALIKRNIMIVFFFVAFMASLLFAFQTPLLDLLVYFQIPVLSTSAASRIIVLASFSGALLAGFGLDNLIKSIKNKTTIGIYICLIIDILIILVLWIIVIKTPLIEEDKVFIALSNLRLPTLIFAAFTILTLAYLFIKKRFVLPLFIAIVISITAFDLLRFSTKWQPFEAPDLMYEKTPVAEFLEETAEPYDRALGNYGAEAAIIDFKVATPEGYDPLYIKEYGEFIRSSEDGQYKSSLRSVVSFPKTGEFTDPVLNMLGVKYIINKIADGRAPWVFPVWDYEVDHFVMVYEDAHYQIFENHRVFPRAYIVEEYEVVKDDRETINAVFDKDKDLKKTVVLNKDIDMNLASGSARITEYGPNSLTIEVNSGGESLLVLSDPYYPGWKAYVNGEEVEVLKTNYAFRGVIVPQGKSTVRFSYEPSSFKYGLVLAGLGIVGIIGLNILSYRRK